MMESVFNRFLFFLERLWIKSVDLFLNIDTVPPAVEANWLGDSSAPYTPDEAPTRHLHADGTPYASPNYLHLWRIHRSLRLDPEDVVYDLGCGMGRFICVMARGKSRKCVGVELYPSLCNVARRNALKLRKRRASIEITCGDAAAADLSEGTIYFMFNPFGIQTMKQVLARIEASQSEYGRAIAIVYYNSIHAELLDASGWLKKIGGFSTFTGRTVTFWGNRLWEERKCSPRRA